MDSPSVLVIRLDAIGDALALTPLLAAFRERSIPVDLVMSAVNAAVFSSRAARAIEIAPFALRSSTSENLHAIGEFGERLRSRGYSHVLVATEDPGGYRLARAVAAPVRIGFSNGWGKPFKSLWVRSMLTETVVRSAGLDPKAPHESDVLFGLARSLLGNAAPTRDVAKLRPLVLEREVPREERVAFQVTEKWVRLGIAFGDVVDAFARASNEAVLRPIASAAEAPFVREFERAARCTVECFDTLEPWKEAIAASAALIAPDSGAIHVAGMTGTPVLAVFDPRAPFALQSARWAPWAARYVNLRGSAGWQETIPQNLRELASAAGARTPVDLH